MIRIKRAILSFVYFFILSVNCQIHSSHSIDETKFFGIEASKARQYGRVHFPSEECDALSTRFYRETLQKMEHRRKELGKIKKKTTDGVSFNIACFSIGLRDKDGSLLTKDQRAKGQPIFFGTHLVAELEKIQGLFEKGFGITQTSHIISQTQEKLKSALLEPHFFTSGRLEKEKLLESAHTKEGLGSGAIAKEIKSIREQDSLDASIKEKMPDLTCLYDPPINTTEVIDFVKKYRQVRSKLQKVGKTASEEDVFQQIGIRRVLDERSTLEKDWAKLLDRRSQKLAHKDPLLTIASTRSVPGTMMFENELLFVHSEQLILARLAHELPDFLKWSLRAFEIDRQEIASYEINIFTRNTICARCAVSCLADLHLPIAPARNDNILGVINYFLAAEDGLPDVRDFKGVRVISKEPCTTKVLETDENGKPKLDMKLQDLLKDTEPQYYDFEWAEADEKYLHFLLRQIILSPAEVSRIIRIDPFLFSLCVFLKDACQSILSSEGYVHGVCEELSAGPAGELLEGPSLAGSAFC